MSLIRWGFLAAMALAFLLLANSNWTLVPFVLPNGTPAPVPLPLLLAAAFLAGMIPTWLWHALLRPIAESRRSRIRSLGPDRTEQTAIAPDLSTNLGNGGMVPPAGA